MYFYLVLNFFDMCVFSRTSKRTKVDSESKLSVKRGRVLMKYTGHRNARLAGS